jgi:cold shock protein
MDLFVPDDGGEDVFLHASVFDGDLDVLAPGMGVESKIMVGDPARKALASHLIDEAHWRDKRCCPKCRG